MVRPSLLIPATLLLALSVQAQDATPAAGNSTPAPAPVSPAPAPAPAVGTPNPLSWTKGNTTITLSGVANVYYNSDGTNHEAQFRRSYMDFVVNQKLEGGKTAGVKVRLWTESFFDRDGDGKIPMPGFPSNTRPTLEVMNELIVYMKGISISEATKGILELQVEGGRGYVPFGFTRAEEQAVGMDFPITIHPLTKADPGTANLGVGQTMYATLSLVKKVNGKEDIRVDVSTFSTAAQDSDRLAIEAPDTFGSFAVRVTKNLEVQGLGTLNPMFSYARQQNIDGSTSDRYAYGTKFSRTINADLVASGLVEFSNKIDHLTTGLTRKFDGWVAQGALNYKKINTVYGRVGGANYNNGTKDLRFGYTRQLYQNPNHSAVKLMWTSEYGRVSTGTNTSTTKRTNEYRTGVRFTF